MLGFPRTVIKVCMGLFGSDIAHTLSLRKPVKVH